MMAGATSLTFRPPALEGLTNLLIRRLPHPEKCYFLGGCLRDYLLKQSPRDYDIITGHSSKKLQELLTEARVPFRLKKHSGHIYCRLDDTTVQFMEYLPVTPDFTLNTLKCYLVRGVIEGSPEAFADLQRGVLRAIDPSPRSLRRGIYMLHRYPNLLISRETHQLWASCNPDPEILKNFLRKKRMSPLHFYEIATRLGFSESKFHFLLK